MSMTILLGIAALVALALGADAVFSRAAHDNPVTVAGAAAVGEVRQLADGRAAVLNGSSAALQGDRRYFISEGQWVVQKKTGEAWVAGQRIYWDHSARNATCLTPTSDRDFYLGTAVGDALAAATTGAVDLNVQQSCIVDLRQGTWTAEATNGLGVTPLVGGGVQLAFDAVAEAAQAAIYSHRTFAVSANWIVEGRVAIFDKGDNAALDFDIGVASASHATDFEAIAEFCSIHFDGNTLDLDTQSDDGTADVAPVDSTVDAVDDTYFDFVIDGRDPADIQIYINGVLVSGATVFRLDNAAGPLMAIVHLEKTSDDTVADVRVAELRVRIAEQ